MKAVIQRVLSAAVEAEGERIASVGRGFLLLLGVTAEDDEAAAAGWRKKRRSCGSSRMKRAG